MLLIATKVDAAGVEHTMPLMGSTRDISESGLALLVAAKNVSMLYNLGQNYTLQLVLTLPNGPVEVEASPARYEHINEGPAGSRILIGAQITRISDEHRSRFIQYLDSFR